MQPYKVKRNMYKSVYCFRFGSDEEAEDEKALLYLPISPEVDEPEEPTWAPTSDPVRSYYLYISRI